MKFHAFFIGILLFTLIPSFFEWIYSTFSEKINVVLVNTVKSLVRVIANDKVLLKI